MDLVHNNEEPAGVIQMQHQSDLTDSTAALFQFDFSAAAKHGGL